MKNALFMFIGIAAICAGCTVTIPQSAIDALAGLTNNPPEAVKDVPFVADSSTVTDTKPLPESWAIPAFTGRYSRGAKDSEYGEEIWNSNWHRMNIRIHANPGEFRREGVSAAGPWYPILASVIPDGVVTMQKTSEGCTLTARDFVSSASGQAYRFEGWRCDGIGDRMQRVYAIKLTQAQMYGACFAWYATIEK